MRVIRIIYSSDPLVQNGIRIVDFHFTCINAMHSASRKPKTVDL